MLLVVGGLFVAAQNHETSRAPLGTGEIGRTNSKKTGTSESVAADQSAKEGPITDLNAEYERQSEGACTWTPDALQVLDLQGDGTKFYVVDEGKIKCQGLSYFCGSAGCGLSVYVKKSGIYENIFNDVVERYSFRREQVGSSLFIEYKTIGTAKYRFERGCAIEMGTQKPPSCGQSEAGSNPPSQPAALSSGREAGEQIAGTRVTRADESENESAAVVPADVPSSMPSQSHLDIPCPVGGGISVLRGVASRQPSSGHFVLKTEEPFCLTLTPPVAQRQRVLLSSVEIDGTPPPSGVLIELTGKLYANPLGPDGSEVPTLSVSSGKRVHAVNSSAQTR